MPDYLDPTSRVHEKVSGARKLLEAGVHSQICMRTHFFEYDANACKFQLWFLEYQLQKKFQNGNATVAWLHISGLQWGVVARYDLILHKN